MGTDYIACRTTWEGLPVTQHAQSVHSHQLKRWMDCLAESVVWTRGVCLAPPKAINLHKVHKRGRCGGGGVKSHDLVTQRLHQPPPPLHPPSHRGWQVQQQAEAGLVMVREERHSELQPRPRQLLGVRLLDHLRRRAWRQQTPRTPVLLLSQLRGHQRAPRHPKHQYYLPQSMMAGREAVQRGLRRGCCQKWQGRQGP